MLRAPTTRQIYGCLTGSTKSVIFFQVWIVFIFQYSVLIGHFFLSFLSIVLIILIIEIALYPWCFLALRNRFFADQSGIMPYLPIYGYISAGNSVFTLFRAFMFAYAGIQAALVRMVSMVSINSLVVSCFRLSIHNCSNVCSRLQWSFSIPLQ